MRNIIVLLLLLLLLLLLIIIIVIFDIILHYPPIPPHCLGSLAGIIFDSQRGLHPGGMVQLCGKIPAWMLKQGARSVNHEFSH